MKKLNDDIETRDKIIYGKYKSAPYKFTGYRSFSGMEADVLTDLLDNNFADPDETCGYSPTIYEIREFLRDYPDYTAHGYSADNKDGNYGIVICGVEKGSPSDSSDELHDYMRLFGNADEFDETNMRCCYDML